VGLQPTPDQEGKFSSKTSLLDRPPYRLGEVVDNILLYKNSKKHIKKAHKKRTSNVLFALSYCYFILGELKVKLKASILTS
jgi:hypothetical protein